MYEQVNACEVIFNKPFWCQVPQAYLYSEAQLKIFGTPSTGDKDIDRELASSPVDIFLTIAGMVEYFSEGCSIRFHKPEQIPEIYELVVNHLKDWAYILNHVFPMTHPPIDDFVLLDAFGRQIAPLAERYRDKTAWTDMSTRFRTLRATNIGRRKTTSQRITELKNSVSLSPGSNGEFTPIKLIIEKLWSPDYEHSRNGSVQGDSADRAEWRQNDGVPMAGSHPQWWEDGKAPVRK